MKRSLIFLLALILIICFVFAACAAKDKEKTTEANSSGDSVSNLDNYDTEFGFESEAVTDDKGKEVVDSNGNTVTTEVAVVYKRDKKGNVVVQKLDNNGEEVTDKKGHPVTVKTTKESTTKKKKVTTTKASNTTTTKNNETDPTSSTQPATTNNDVEPTKEKDTTRFDDEEVVPKTSDTGKEVQFSPEDMQTIAAMLEVPYLYKSSYENTDGVPIDIATYTAVWMAQLNGETSVDYPSSPVVLNLFKYYGQTVVNFKTKCNGIKNTPIKYVKKDDTFKISEFTTKKQSVNITKIEDLGNNNFYKVTGTVTDAGKINKVVAIVQKNRLEPLLGFSVKALKWS